MYVLKDFPVYLKNGRFNYNTDLEIDSEYVGVVSFSIEKVGNTDTYEKVFIRIPADWKYYTPSFEEALVLSIRKWWCMVQWYESHFVIDSRTTALLDGSGETCALCRKYFMENCYGCPVPIATGKTGCIASPWIDHKTAITFEDAMVAAYKELALLTDIYLNWLEGDLEDGVDFLDEVSTFFPGTDKVLQVYGHEEYDDDIPF